MSETEKVLDPNKAAGEVEIVETAVDAAKESVRNAVSKAVEKAVRDATRETKQDLRSAIEKTAQEMRLMEDELEELGHEDANAAESIKTRPHAFVVMPFGKKKGFNDQWFDFNAIYQGLIKPALESAGFEPFRADEETVSGDILTDMFQELLLADLVLCDMSIDNANVFYELGIRHAFRKRGVVHIQSGRAYMPFDIFNVRTIPYHTTPEGVPDPEYLDKDIQTIARVSVDTWISDKEAVHSPVFNLLPGLPEPDRRSLRTPKATGFWREYNEWRERVTVAQRQKRIGDILLLTEEITNPLIKEEALGEAGRAMNDMGLHELALEQYRKGLEINSANLEFRRKEAMHLNRLGKVDEAVVKLENLLVDFPNDSEAVGYLGRIYKDMWQDSWRWVSDAEQRVCMAFEAYHWLLRATHTYLSGYRHDLNNTYPGANALTLAKILVHLADKYDDPDDPDPEITEIRQLLPVLEDTLLFALEKQIADEKTDYWSLVSMADLLVMTSDSLHKVVRAYRKAFTAARKNLFFLQSSRYTLEMLRSLGLREQSVTAGIDAIDAEIRRITKRAADDADQEDKKGDEKPVEHRAFLFAGYTVDLPEQRHKRFPANQEEAVSAAIKRILEKHEAGANDIAFLPGLSCGSEILFAEACVERSVPVEVYLCATEAAYISKFVGVGGDAWIERFYHLRNHPGLKIYIQADHVGKAKRGMDIYERNNRWALYSSLKYGIDKVRLVALWDGKLDAPKDLSGRLVRHMVDQMRQMGGVIEHINSTQFEPIPTAEEAFMDLMGDVKTMARRKR